MSNRFGRVLKNKLNAIPLLEPRQAHLDETAKLCLAEYTSRRQMRSLSSLKMIISQLRFIAKPIWILQIAVMFCLCFTLHFVSKANNPVIYVPVFLSLSSIFIAMTMLPFYGRSRKHKMREIESTTRLSHARLILSKICVIGVGDIMCLLVLSLFSIGKMAEAANTILFFIVLPFLLASSGILLILNHTKEDYGMFAALGYCVGLSVVYWMLRAKVSFVFAQFGLIVAGIICVILLLVLTIECRKLLRQIPSPDLQEELIY